MDLFCKELARFGTVSHFRHFTLQLRGREELLVTVSRAREREPPSSGGGSGRASSYASSSASPSGSVRLGLPMHLQRVADPVSSLRGRPPPLDDLNWGRALSDSEEGFDRAPASPCSRERLRAGEQEVIFLVGAYMHYRCPYVWVRAGHAYLHGFGAAGSATAEDGLDVPLRLRSLSHWHKAPEDGKRLDVHLWDVLAELVLLHLKGRAENPFEVNLGEVAALPSRECAMVSAGLATFLRQVYLGSDELADLIEADYLALLQLHYTALHALLPQDVPADMLRASEGDERGQLSEHPAMAAAVAECTAALDTSWPGRGRGGASGGTSPTTSSSTGFGCQSTSPLVRSRGLSPVLLRSPIAVSPRRGAEVPWAGQGADVQSSVPPPLTKLNNRQ